MKLNKKWTSIAEAIIVMMIVTIWVVWMYNIYNNSQNLSNNSINRLKAIDIAREWIEAVTNVRDTNWLLFWANLDNCWDTYNYDSSCITNNVNISSRSYIIYKNNENRWILEPKTTWNYSSWTYRNNFEVKTDDKWFYTQSWWTNKIIPLFTREIKINNLWQEMNVKSIVRWTDSWRNSWNYEVKLETTLTNWKK